MMKHVQGLGLLAVECASHQNDSVLWVESKDSSCWLLICQQFSPQIHNGKMGSQLIVLVARLYYEFGELG